MFLIVDNGSIFNKELLNYFKKRKLKYIVAKKNSKLQTILKHKIKGVFLTGGPSRYDSKILMEDIAINLAVLLDLDVPVLGICFGHQTIVEAFGGKIKKLNRHIHRMEQITITKSNPILKGLPKKLTVMQSHKDFAHVVPYNFIVNGKSKTSTIEAMKHKTKHIYGVQFHPEASGDYGELVLDNFVKICKRNS